MKPVREPGHPCKLCGAARTCEHSEAAHNAPSLADEPAKKRDYSGAGLNFGARRYPNGRHAARRGPREG